ncbi:hypothetical protein QRO11_05050 [Paracidovorax citrulli]|uniref:hypothetical protein n=1 Tax=Paracidovorax citrulli TaxID=80869 RepID=UPI0005FC0F02|nr:hypothetical protein [Paracidovorax citrulli]QCX09804.1 hypothetical protein APS58_0885 [Paracidovorax citrulli]UEG47201.1 hypothetical protein LKW27_04800 [Paracidovorax citrulli]UMT89523.1 hypothetical protein FRC90_16605 [Paracidovorax citrulli]UMT93601.1 hypothetical protein FRC97_00420 [Paracidovorax citrulli]WIY35713.1 hypothetical protein QRO11_05050 [Paracidovorax citrulli]
MTAPISRKGPSLGPDAARATETLPGQAPTGRPSSEGPAAPAGLARRALQPQGGVAGRTRTAALPQHPAVARQAASPAGSPVAAQRKAAASAADGTLLLAALQQDLSVPGHQEAAHGVAILHGQAALAGLDRSLPSDLAGARRGAEQAALAFGALHGGDRMPDAAVEALLDGAASRRAEAMVGAMAPLPPLPFEPIDERAIVPDAMVHGMNALEPASGTALRERARSLQEDITTPGSDGNVLAAQIALGAAGHGGHAEAGRHVGAALVLRLQASTLAVPDLGVLGAAVSSGAVRGQAALAKVMETAVAAPLFMVEPAAGDAGARAPSPVQGLQARRAAQSVGRSSATMAELARSVSAPGSLPQARALAEDAPERGTLQRSGRAVGQSIGAFQAIASLMRPVAG